MYVPPLLFGSFARRYDLYRVSSEQPELSLLLSVVLRNIYHYVFKIFSGYDSGPSIAPIWASRKNWHYFGNRHYSTYYDTATGCFPAAIVLLVLWDGSPAAGKYLAWNGGVEAHRGGWYA